MRKLPLQNFNSQLLFKKSLVESFTKAFRGIIKGKIENGMESKNQLNSWQHKTMEICYAHFFGQLFYNVVEV